MTCAWFGGKRSRERWKGAVGGFSQPHFSRGSFSPKSDLFLLSVADQSPCAPKHTVASADSIKWQPTHGLQVIVRLCVCDSDAEYLHEEQSFAYDDES